MADLRNLIQTPQLQSNGPDARCPWDRSPLGQASPELLQTLLRMMMDPVLLVDLDTGATRAMNQAAAKWLTGGDTECEAPSVHLGGLGDSGLLGRLRQELSRPGSTPIVRVTSSSTDSPISSPQLSVGDPSQPTVTAELSPPRHASGVEETSSEAVKFLASRCESESTFALLVGTRPDDSAEEPSAPSRDPDCLTQLPGRRQLIERLEAKLQYSGRADESAGFGVLFIDLDDFKLVNDQWGHPVGDLVLVQVAERLRNCFRDDDLVCRYGGDEFVCVVENVSDEEPLRGLHSRIQKAFDRPISFVCDGIEKSIVLGVSVGAVVAGSRDAHWQELVTRADKAMYVAKRRPR